MSATTPNRQSFYPQIDKSVDPKVTLHLQIMYPALNDHDKAIASLNTKVANIVAGKTVINTTTSAAASSGGSSIAGVSAFNSLTGAITFFPFLGTKNDQTGNATYSVQNSDNGALLIVGDAIPVLVSLNSAVTNPYFFVITNSGAGTATLTPTTGTINGGASFLLPQNFTTYVVFDGTNWQASALLVIPLNTPAIAHQWIKDYDSSTGLFTQSQPAFSDISGIATPAQLPTATTLDLGVVQPDGTSIAVSGSGVISVINGPVPKFADGETPGGVIDGTNVTFTLANAPNPPLSLILSRGGMVQQQGVGDDYTLSGNTITFVVAPSSGPLIAWYRY